MWKSLFTFSRRKAKREISQQSKYDQRALPEQSTRKSSRAVGPGATAIPTLIVPEQRADSDKEKANDVEEHAGDCCLSSDDLKAIAETKIISPSCTKKDGASQSQDSNSKSSSTDAKGNGHEESTDFTYFDFLGLLCGASLILELFLPRAHHKATSEATKAPDCGFDPSSEEGIEQTLMMDEIGDWAQVCNAIDGSRDSSLYNGSEKTSQTVRETGIPTHRLVPDSADASTDDDSCLKTDTLSIERHVCNTTLVAPHQIQRDTIVDVSDDQKLPSEGSNRNTEKNYGMALSGLNPKALDNQHQTASKKTRVRSFKSLLGSQRLRTNTRSQGVGIAVNGSSTSLKTKTKTGLRRGGYSNASNQRRKESGPLPPEQNRKRLGFWKKKLLNQNPRLASKSMEEPRLEAAKVSAMKAAAVPCPYRNSATNLPTVNAMEKECEPNMGTCHDYHFDNNGTQRRYVQEQPLVKTPSADSTKHKGKIGSPTMPPEQHVLMRAHAPFADKNKKGSDCDNISTMSTHMSMFQMPMLKIEGDPDSIKKKKMKKKRRVGIHMFLLFNGRSP
jgi:hypothetical protein